MISLLPSSHHFFTSFLHISSNLSIHQTYQFIKPINSSNLSLSNSQISNSNSQNPLNPSPHNFLYSPVPLFPQKQKQKQKQGWALLINPPSAIRHIEGVYTLTYSLLLTPYNTQFKIKSPCLPKQKKKQKKKTKKNKKKFIPRPKLNQKIRFLSFFPQNWSLREMFRNAR